MDKYAATALPDRNQGDICCFDSSFSTTEVQLDLIYKFFNFEDIPHLIENCYR